MHDRGREVRDGLVVWQCSACKEFKPEGDFYKDSRQAGGVKSQCKTCHNAGSIRTRDPDLHRDTNREAMRRMRAANPEKYRQQAQRERHDPTTRQRVLARKLLQHEVRKGRIVRPTTCSRCGRGGKIEGHHPDYAKPLDVVWLCTICHGQE